MLKLTESVINWTKDYFKDNNNGKAIIGISGGKDSTICAAILKEAIGADRIIAVMMPNGIQRDIADSYRVCDYIGIPKENRYVININNAYNGLMNELLREIYAGSDGNIVDTYFNPMITTNLPARLRMCTLYAVAAIYPNSRVVNTSNASERFVGYSTKWGDGAGDFSISANLTYTEMLTIGDDLLLPEDLVHKKPSDGMSGSTDEQKLGFSYDEVDKHICDDNYRSEFTDKIQRMHNMNYHKIAPMPSWTRCWDLDSYHLY